MIVFKLSSSTDGVYGIMKYESGVHRVQRVPQTETQGRIQTSAASVAVFPEAGEFDIELNPADIRKDLFCASGPGGQGVNTTYSAVRLTRCEVLSTPSRWFGVTYKEDRPAVVEKFASLVREGVYPSPLYK